MKIRILLLVAFVSLIPFFGFSQTEKPQTFKGIIIDKNKAVISFDHSEGLHAAGDKLTYFEIAGDDKIFYPAEAKIKDGKVIVQSKNVKTPVAVRFAWKNTAVPNLFNGVNLPASCFTSEN